MEMGMKAQEALDRLMEGNRKFIQATTHQTDVSLPVREGLVKEGQHPFATVISCSDSRVIPEHVFMCGLGDIFCVRTAGNTIGPGELASALYGCEHLGTQLLMVMGHTGCGAVASAIESDDHGPLAPILGKVEQAIGDERDPYAATVANARASVRDLRENPELSHLVGEGKLTILAAVFHTDSGEVELL